MRPRNKNKRAKKKASPTVGNKGTTLDAEFKHPSPPTASQIPPDSNDDKHPDGQRDQAPRECIESRWNGPRVLDVAAFLTSRHAAAPAADDPGCAIYASASVREMLLQVLPEETALILWYNKSRTSARICPACRRCYSVGDILLPHLLDDQSGSRKEYVDPRNLHEKRISGICSLMCFAVASYNWHGVIGAWGKRASEIDAATYAILLGPGANIADAGMGAFMKLSRMENMIDVVSETFRAGLTLY